MQKMKVHKTICKQLIEKSTSWVCVKGEMDWHRIKQKGSKEMGMEKWKISGNSWIRREKWVSWVEIHQKKSP